MSKKINVKQYGLIHYIAYCDVCDFNASINTEETPTRADVRNAVRKHVLKTGHSAIIEGGKTTKYSKNFVGTISK